MTYEKKYTINPDEWERFDAETWIYIDDDLQMRVILERETAPANSLPWERILYSGWTLRADSSTYEDENNPFFYDALSRDFTCAPVLTRTDGPLFFEDEEQEKPNPVLLPDWLIEHMRYLADQDAKADADVYEWAQGVDGATFASYDDMRRSARDRHARHHANDGQYPYGVDSMLYMGEQTGIIRECNSAAQPKNGYMVQI